MNKISKNEAINKIMKTAKEEALALYVCECYDMHLIEVLLKDSIEDDGVNYGTYGFNFHMFHGFTTLKGDNNASNFYIIYNGQRNMPARPFVLYRTGDKVYMQNKKTGSSRYLGRISTMFKEDNKKLEMYEKNMEKTAENIKGITNFKELNAELLHFEKLSKKHADILSRRDRIMHDDFARYNYYDEFIF